MKGFWLTAVLLVGLALLIEAQTSEAVGPPATDDPHRVVYLSDRGPLLIALHVQIDGKPLRELHDAFLRKVFDYLDRDGDGVLSRAEAAIAPGPLALSTPAVFAGRGLPDQPRLRVGKKGKVTRAELAAYYRQNGLPAFSGGNLPFLAEQIRVRQASGEATGEQLTERLFALLDTNGDGKLVARELEAAPAVLQALDIDEDEMISAAEVMGEATGTGVSPPVFVTVTSRSSTQPLHVLAESADEVLARILLSHYGKKGDTSLPASALGLSKKELAVLDRDGDGQLSRAELARFGEKPADVTLTVNINSDTGRAEMTVKEGTPLPKGLQAKETPNGAMLQLGTTRLDLAGLRPPSPIRGNLLNRIRAASRMLFQEADTNKDGYLSRQEAARGFFRTVFDAMDRDGDGRVSEKEMLAWVDQMETFRQQLERSCVSLAVSNEGKGLFDLLDTNGDGKLSVRELRAAPKLLARLGADKAGYLTRSDVPRRYQVGLVLGPNGGRGPLGQRTVARVRPDMRGRRPTASRGPLWFQKMDRNRDGDVSRKEFLGTDEQFKAIDTDGDGLISIQEAEAFDKRKPTIVENPRRERSRERR